MKQIIALAVLLAPMAAWAEDWRVLTGPDLNAALAARVLQYEDGANIEGASQNFFQDGRTLYEAGSAESWGKWWVDGAHYCSTWPPSATKTCYKVEASGLFLRFTGQTGDIALGRYIDLN